MTRLTDRLHVVVNAVKSNSRQHAAQVYGAMNLTDFLVNQNNGAVVQELGRRFNLDHDQTVQAIEALMPAFSHGLKRNTALMRDVLCGESRQLSVAAGALVSITNVDGGGPVLVTALTDDSRTFSPAPLGSGGLADGTLADASVAETSLAHTSLADTSLGAVVSLDSFVFDRADMASIAASRDTTLASAKAVPLFDSASLAGESFTFRVAKQCALFVVAPVQTGYLTNGGGSRFRVEVQLPAGRSDGAVLPQQTLGNVTELLEQ